MATPYTGEIRMFAGSYAPTGWAFCNGTLINVDQNPALFSILGSTFGGDGRTTFGLPDLQSRTPIGRGSGAGLTPRSIGNQGGAENVTLTANQLANHTHTVQGDEGSLDRGDPENNVLAEPPGNFYRAPDTLADMAAGTIVATGGSDSHANIQPFLAVNFIIATTGQIPTQT